MKLMWELEDRIRTLETHNATLREVAREAAEYLEELVTEQKAINSFSSLRFAVALDKHAAKLRAEEEKKP